MTAQAWGRWLNRCRSFLRRYRPPAHSLYVTDLEIRIRDLERCNAELRAAVMVAGREIKKLNFGKKNPPILVLLRRVLREARQVAKSRLASAA
jgi:hypothetical protein